MQRACRRQQLRSSPPCWRTLRSAVRSSVWCLHSRHLVHPPPPAPCHGPSYQAVRLPGHMCRRSAARLVSTSAVAGCCLVRPMNGPRFRPLPLTPLQCSSMQQWRARPSNAAALQGRCCLGSPWAKRSLLQQLMRSCGQLWRGASVQCGGLLRQLRPPALKRCQTLPQSLRPSIHTADMKASGELPFRCRLIPWLVALFQVTPL